MDKVVKTCPTCGEELSLKNDNLYCPNCKKIYLDVLGEFVGDDTEMSAIEFASKMEKSGKQFLINIEDKIDVNDVDAIVLSKKIETASSQIQSGNFDKALETLNGAKSTFPVERLRLLAKLKVKNERELLHFKADISEDEYFKNALSVADSDTRETYLEIAKFCKGNNDNRATMKAEVDKIEELLQVGLKDEAVVFAKGMCEKYPQYVYALSAYYYAQYLVGKYDDETWDKIEKSLDNGELYPKFLKIIGNEQVGSLKDYTEREKQNAKKRQKRYPAQIIVVLIAFALAVLTVVIAVKDWGFGWLIFAWIVSMLMIFFSIGSYYDDKMVEGLRREAFSKEKLKLFGIKTLKIITKITTVLLILAFLLAISSCGIQCSNCLGCN